VRVEVAPTGSDLHTVLAHAPVVLAPMDLTDNGAVVTVTSVNRAFFLGATYLPGTYSQYTVLL
jgi:hypothetical protein